MHILVYRAVLGLSRPTLRALGSEVHVTTFTSGFPLLDCILSLVHVSFVSDPSRVMVLPCLILLCQGDGLFSDGLGWILIADWRPFDMPASADHPHIHLW